MRPEATAVERFEGWYVKAVEKLRELPEGDGAFAAMMIALPLYERLITARLKLAGKESNKADVEREMSLDLGLDDNQRRIFWAMFRNGFTHQAMVTAGGTIWVVSHRFGALPEFTTYQGSPCVRFDPWKFADRVLQAFLQEPQLITVSDSFPLAGVFPVRGQEFGH